MVLLEAAEADDYRLVDLEREEAEEAAAAEAKLAAKRERAKVALGMLGARFERLDDAAGRPRTPRTAAAQAPELGGTDGSGVADPSWVTKVVAREAELGGTAEREAAVMRMQARQRGKLDRRHTADRVEQGEMAGQKRAKKAAEQELAAQLPDPNPEP